MSPRDQRLPAHQAYPVFPSLLPPAGVEQHRYRVAFANTRDELAPSPGAARGVTLPAATGQPLGAGGQRR
jgi:hypothetical protein